MQIVTWSQLQQTERQQILSRSAVVDDEAVNLTVAEIIQQVRARGDAALLEYGRKFDGVALTALAVTQDEFMAAKQLPSSAQQAILTALANIRDYHQHQLPQPFNYERDGASLGKVYRPIEKVGLYIPGGSAPLVSTLLMLAVPAILAGCQQIVLVTPPNQHGQINPAILFAAQACGIDNLYKVGGAQAIAALAFGTATIPKTYKIFGPGNKYVTAAKQQVAMLSGGAALDMPAGPSEVLVIADAAANPMLVASDLLAQAEHDVAAQVLLVTTSPELAQAVAAEVKRQSAYLKRQAIINQALKNSAVIIVSELGEAFAIANSYAPEHLMLHLIQADNYLDQVHNAGSVFIGQWTPEAVGDYASGPNHVLPTYGYANMYSGLDVMAFMKAISWQKLSPTGLAKLGPVVECLATLEGLDAHKNAVSVRLASLE